ncbi:MAG: glycoside hydrolase family 99-like domain-containing protein [Chitinophagaceae bacterium]
MASQARFIAYYLPQFHPVPENDHQWGKGFTEWTNVGKGKSLFKGHYQPFLPTELGYYDLRLPEVRKAQAQLAKEYGIEGFCYWHYWFGGKRMLEMPFNEVVRSGEPDFPFCLCWANHSWSAIWVGDTKTVIVEQTYPGIEDYKKHFYELLPAFKDERYIKVNGRLLFSIFAPKDIPDCKLFTDIWQQLAKQEGLDGFHFTGIGVNVGELEKLGLHAATPHTPHSFLSQLKIRLVDKLSYRLTGKSYIDFKAKKLGIPRVYAYADFVEANLKKQYQLHEYPVALPNWDHSPRSGNRAIVLQDSSPELFGRIIHHCVEAVKDRQLEERIIFLKAWNEWAEGNFLEPEKLHGRGYLEEIRKALI